MKKVILFLVVIMFFLNCYSIPAASGWNGVCHCIKDYLKDNANDAKSIKYVNCGYILEFSNGLYGQRVKSRG